MAYETVFNPRHLGMTGKGLLPVRRKGKRENKKIKYKKKCTPIPFLIGWVKPTIVAGYVIFISL